MQTGFSLVDIKGNSSKLSDKLFKKAVTMFNKEYTPADFVEITEIEHMEVTYKPKTQVFVHTFCIHWQENK